MSLHLPLDDVNGSRAVGDAAMYERYSVGIFDPRQCYIEVAAAESVRTKNWRDFGIMRIEPATAFRVGVAMMVCGLAAMFLIQIWVLLR